MANPLMGQLPYPTPMTLAEVTQQQRDRKLALAQAAQQQKMKEAQTALTEAQTQKLMYGMEHPTESLAGLPEIARQRARLRNLGTKYGTDSKIFQEAQSDLELTLKNLRGQIAYRKALEETLPKRALSSMGKGQLEKRYVGAGLSPTGQPLELPAPSQEITPVREDLSRPQVDEASRPQVVSSSMENKLAQITEEDLPRLSKAEFGSEDSALYSLHLSRLAGLTNNANKLASGALVEKTMDLIEEYRPSMAYYSGYKGKLRYVRDVKNAQTSGEMSPQLTDYTKFAEIATSTLVPQITQYYGLSVTEPQRKLLASAANPSTWENSPEMAMTAFNTLMNTLEQEIQVRRDIVEKPTRLLAKPKKKGVIDKFDLSGTGHSMQDVIKIADEIGVSVNDLIQDMRSDK